MSKLFQPFALCSFFFGIISIFSFSCNQSGDKKLSHDDSLSIYNYLVKQHLYYFGKSSKSEQAALSDRIKNNAFTTYITADSAWQLVNNYKKKPIQELTVYNPDSVTHLVAWEVDSHIKDLLKDPNVDGLRLYLGKRGEDNYYTIVIVAKDAAGNNYFSKTNPMNQALDWNLPCPYNCPGTALDFGNDGTPKPGIK